MFGFLEANSSELENLVNSNRIKVDTKKVKFLLPILKTKNKLGKCNGFKNVS